MREPNFSIYLRELILSEHSKEMTAHIAAEIGNDQKRFDALIQLILESEYRIIQRAAWAMSMVCEKYPALINPHIHMLILKLSEPKQDALHRNVLRIFQEIDIPKEEQGVLADACFQFLYNMETPIAVKAFSMTVLHNICKEEPELAAELCMYIEDRMSFEAPAFRSRGKRILAYWRK